VQVVTAAGFLLAAGAKFAGAAPVVATFDAIGLGDWLRYTIGVLEVLGAIALLVPRVAGLAGLAFVVLLVGAAFTHVVIIGQGVANTVPLLVLSAVVAWGRRSTTADLMRLVR
jgi:putative oxidoreductase